MHAALPALDIQRLPYRSTSSYGRSSREILLLQRMPAAFVAEVVQEKLRKENGLEGVEAGVFVTVSEEGYCGGSCSSLLQIIMLLHSAPSNSFKSHVQEGTPTFDRRMILRTCPCPKTKFAAARRIGCLCHLPCNMIFDSAHSGCKVVSWQHNHTKSPRPVDLVADVTTKSYLACSRLQDIFLKNKPWQFNAAKCIPSASYQTPDFAEKDCRILEGHGYCRGKSGLHQPCVHFARLEGDLPTSVLAIERCECYYHS